MERPGTTMLRIGDWRVDPISGRISRNGETARLEARTMRLLLCLAEHAGEVVSIDDLLDQVWSGVAVTPDSVYQAVATLRKLLGDDPKQPAYIATVPRLGYRMVAAVNRWEDRPSAEFADPGHSSAASERQPPVSTVDQDAQYVTPKERGLRVVFARAGVGALCLGLVLAFIFRDKIAGAYHSAPRAASPPTSTVPQKSIAVLPFLDLTEGMKNETFADGMTEELIDRLSKLPELRVPSATSSFYFKGKQVPVAEIAKTLRVAYVLDGSVRRSGSTVRIAARLIRADNGFVIWSETYDRSFDDILMIQDDIAGEVTKALKASIERAPELQDTPRS